jgi:pimeloyl-ACP methyl ester carboxylesterase
MNKKFVNIISICILFASLHGTSQEAVSSNGKFATIGGLKIYYEESGKGTPIILLHHFFASASQWKTYAPELAKKYRVIAVDLPGHARSDYMDTTQVYLHKKAAENIIGLIDFLKLDSVYLIGASSGAFIAVYLATLRPELVKRVVVIGGLMYRSQYVRKVLANWSKDADATQIAQHGKEKAELLHKQLTYFSQLYGDPSFTPDVLSIISARTLIIHGDNDPLSPMSNALEMHQYISNSYLWIVPNGGHFCFPPYLDAKNESDFVKRTMEFLNGDWDKK